MNRANEPLPNFGLFRTRSPLLRYGGFGHSARVTLRMSCTGHYMSLDVGRCSHEYDVAVVLHAGLSKIGKGCHIGDDIPSSGLTCAHRAAYSSRFSNSDTNVKGSLFFTFHDPFFLN